MSELIPGIERATDLADLLFVLRAEIVNDPELAIAMIDDIVKKLDKVKS